MRRTLVLLAACVALAACGDAAKAPARGTVLQVGDASVRVEVAADEASRERGLSGRDALAPDAGMLFVLAGDRPAFWMRGMRFPLDIVWIDGRRVVDVTANVPPPTAAAGTLPTYSPRRPANRALEVNAGWAARHGVRRGDAVRVRRGGASE
jgi:uncharacterized membrane protein (UPF0127 family)